MEQNDEFIRVGTTYYKIVDQPLVVFRGASKPYDRTTARTL